MSKGKKDRAGGALGPPPLIEPGLVIKVGRMYEISQVAVGIELFDPMAPGWTGMGATAPRRAGRMEPGDTFIAVEQVRGTPVETDELWIVLCRGVLGKCLLSEWDLRTVLEVGTPEET